MILVTGGAGFIGSHLVAAFVQAGEEVVVADRMGAAGKWRNVARHPPAEIVAPEQLEPWLAGDPPLRAVLHMGAISSTTASDADLVWRTNVALSQRLCRWCAAAGVPFVYASSAATYGDGSAGFADGFASLAALRPLNLYGWSKHVFDLWMARRVDRGAAMPPQWAGLKFFNVYGPNEAHKAEMVSVVKVKYDELARGEAPRLFRSDRPEIEDGAQARDFIHVDDVVRVIAWLLANPHVSGLFNCGTGRARSYRDVVRAVCAASGVPFQVEYVDMPEALRGTYQSYTQAEMDALRRAGYDAPFTSLEDGVARYVRDFLAPDRPFL